MTHEPISLIRTTPPTPAWLGDELATTMADIVRRLDLSTLLRHHKFSGSADDKRVAGLWLSRRFGEAPHPDRIIVTNGTQNALFMALTTVVGCDGLLLTESLSYYGLRRLAELLGIKTQPVPMDADGAIPDAFENICRVDKPKALFLTPTIHNPTTIIMSRERRLALADIARRHGVAIIEDDVYGLLPRSAPPPIAALASDVTWHATGLAKCVAPGLRLGYLVAPDADAAARAFQPLQTTSTWFASPLSAAIAECWIENGVAARILEAVRDEASARQAIARRILDGASYQSKPEALHLWLDLPKGWTQDSFIAAGEAQGVVLRSGDMFVVNKDNAPGAIRIVLGSPANRNDLSNALENIASILAAKPQSPGVGARA